MGADLYLQRMHDAVSGGPTPPAQTPQPDQQTLIAATLTWEYGGYESEWQGTLAQLVDMAAHGKIEEGERLTSITITPFIEPETSPRQKQALVLLDGIRDELENAPGIPGAPLPGPEERARRIEQHLADLRKLIQETPLP